MQTYSQIPLVSVKNDEIKLKIQLLRFHVDKKYVWCAVSEVYIDFGLALCQGQVNTPIVWANRKAKILPAPSSLDSERF